MKDRKYPNDFFSSKTRDERILAFHTSEHETAKEISKYLNPASWNEFITLVWFDTEVRKEIQQNKKLEKMLREQRRQLVLDSNTLPLGAPDFLVRLWKIMGQGNSNRRDYPAGNWGRTKMILAEMKLEKEYYESLEKKK